MFFKKGKLNHLKLKFIVFLSVLLYFLSNNVIYSSSIQKNETKYLIPMGNVIQIDAQLDNVFVRNVSYGSPFKVGDLVVEVNNFKVNDYKEYKDALSSLKDNNNVKVVVKRNSSTINLNTSKSELENIKINDLICGFATLTFINPDNNEFAAVGHPLSIGSNRNLPIRNGNISTTNNMYINKSSGGNVGCLQANRLNTVGKFNTCFNYGIKGNIVSFENMDKLQKYEVAKTTDDVKPGKAQIILQNTNDKIEKFDIEILSVENQKTPKHKSFKFKILDKDLLVKSGGVVQGMSGTPIVQDGKIIGAISHALESDPTVGYAIFIQWMLQ